MSTTTEASALKPGDYAPPKLGDIRGPCPGLNALSNHGYIPRDGRNVRVAEVTEGLRQYGLGGFLRWFLTYPCWLERHEKGSKNNSMPWWKIIINPIDFAFSSIGMRDPGQKDSANVPCLNLDQLAAHNVIEHDVSFTRHDFAQGDNYSPQPDLIANLLAASSNGKTITLDDFNNLRRRRYETQKEVHSDLDFDGQHLQIACSEVALMLKIFGGGKEIPVEYLRAFFQDGRIPKIEGWTVRKGWTLGLYELHMFTLKIKGILGPLGQKK